VNSLIINRFVVLQFSGILKNSFKYMQIFGAGIFNKFCTAEKRQISFIAAQVRISGSSQLNIDVFLAIEYRKWILFFSWNYAYYFDSECVKRVWK